MTELMKRYNKETGEKAKKKVLVMYSTNRYGWGREKNHLFFTNKFVKWFKDKYDTLKAENDQLKAQLTWRDVSEPTWKADWFLVKENHKGTIMYDVGWSDGTTFGNSLVVGWLPIPEEVV